MEDLIRALRIFMKYENRHAPTHCEHDILMIVGIDPNSVTPQDMTELDELGFFVSEEFDCFASFRFGSG